MYALGRVFPLNVFPVNLNIRSVRSDRLHKSNRMVLKSERGPAAGFGVCKCLWEVTARKGRTGRPGRVEQSGPDVTGD